MCNQIPTNSNQIVEIKSILLPNTNLGRIKLSNINENCIELLFMYDSSKRANALL